MSRVVHFEIYADDVERCKTFYSDAFGWTYEDYSEFAGSPYYGIITGPDEEHGINGGMMKREKPLEEFIEGYYSYVCTIRRMKRLSDLSDELSTETPLFISKNDQLMEF